MLKVDNVIPLRRVVVSNPNKLILSILYCVNYHIFLHQELNSSLSVAPIHFEHVAGSPLL